MKTKLHAGTPPLMYSSQIQFTVLNNDLKHQYVLLVAQGWTLIGEGPL